MDILRGRALLQPIAVPSFALASGATPSTTLSAGSKTIGRRGPNREKEKRTKKHRNPQIARLSHQPELGSDGEIVCFPAVHAFTSPASNAFRHSSSTPGMARSSLACRSGVQVWRAGLRALVGRRTRQKSALEIKRRKTTPISSSRRISFSSSSEGPRSPWSLVWLRLRREQGNQPALVFISTGFGFLQVKC
jgi:hypothetical protein